MSYSYIKSVFPNFENSNKVYDESLYNNIAILNNNLKLSLPQSENVLDSIQVEHANFKIRGYEEEKEEKIKNKKSIEEMSNMYITEDYSKTPLYKPADQNNLAFFNLPLVYNNKSNEDKKYLKDNKNNNTNDNTNDIKRQENTIEEKFTTSSGDVNIECDGYIKHILDCNKCKNIVTKQFGIDNDKFRNEEMMELASYIVFGLFILLLVDSLKKSRD